MPLAPMSKLAEFRYKIVLANMHISFAATAWVKRAFSGGGEGLGAGGQDVRLHPGRESELCGTKWPIWRTRGSGLPEFTQARSLLRRSRMAAGRVSSSI